MPRKIALSTLNASSIEIINVIRENASYAYQSSVPTITQESDIPAVGQIIYGAPALRNEFISALVNRIAAVRVQSATFNNPYAVLKKGMLEFGETIEDIFVGLAKVVDYSADKAGAREFKRTLPDVQSVFHAVNWKVMYPVTIQNDELKQAFLSIDGVTDLIANIVDQVYVAAEYDEYLLFKYLLIKGITKGQFKPVSIGDGSNYKTAATAFRGTSNKLRFMSPDNNIANVRTNTPIERQVIFMSAEYDAAFDVEVLASAFNMDKAEYLGRRFLIDDWTSYDNERFAEIRAASDGLEEVTDAELTLMGTVKAVLCDEKWFQVYDKLMEFTEKFVASGLYWNYFYHVWKIVSWSPFANAVVFVTSSSSMNAEIDEVEFTVASLDTSANAIVMTFEVSDVEASNADVVGFRDYEFTQNSTLITNSIAVQKYGAVIVPIDGTAEDVSTSELTISVNGTAFETDGIVKTAAVGETPATYKAFDEVAVGDTIVFTPESIL